MRPPKHMADEGAPGVVRLALELRAPWEPVSYTHLTLPTTPYV